MLFGSPMSFRETKPFWTIRFQLPDAFSEKRTHFGKCRNDPNQLQNNQLQKFTRYAIQKNEAIYK